MLSKKAAKMFFIVGTAVCVGSFLLLTLDTIQKVPAQTHSETMTEAVIRGKHLWEENNCMGCHTLLGEGAYYAPELTKVFARRGPSFIKAMLKNPEAMYPGERKMQNYHFSDGQIDDLTDFLKWIGEMDLNGFPATPNLMQVAVANPAGAGAEALAPSRDRPQIFNQMCVACHALGGQGGQVGPTLDDVGARKSRDEIERWLQDPLAMKADSRMPKLPLSPAEIAELVAFLSQQRAGGTK